MRKIFVALITLSLSLTLAAADAEVGPPPFQWGALVGLLLFLFVVFKSFKWLVRGAGSAYREARDQGPGAVFIYFMFWITLFPFMLAYHTWVGAFTSKEDLDDEDLDDAEPTKWKLKLVGLVLFLFVVYKLFIWFV